MTNLAHNLLDTMATHPDRAAVKLDEQILTYTQLWDASARMATLLRRLGVAPGDRVALQLPNVPAFPVACYGTLLAGATVVPMNPLLKAGEVEYYLTDAGAEVVVVDDHSPEAAHQAGARVGAKVLAVGPMGPAELPDDPR